jgi:hypothetical protein
VHVVVGSTTFDVSSRALVIGVLDPALPPEDAVATAQQMVLAGADAIETGGAAEPVRTGVAVPVVSPGDVKCALADDAAAVAVAIARGARLVRTRDVRTARRVADVLAAVIDASGSSQR